MIELLRAHAWRVMPMHAARAVLENTRNHERRETGLSQGLCTKCAIRPPEPGKARCTTCLEGARRYTERRNAERMEAGQCIRCGEAKPPERLHLKHCKPCVAKANGKRADRRRAG